MRAGTGPDGESGRQRVPAQIDIWRKELINLARSNRLLYFRHTRSSTLEIKRDPDEAAEVVRQLLEGGSWKFFFPPDEAEPEEEEELFPSEVVQGRPEPNELVTSKLEAKALRNSLRLLERRASQEFMDKGIWVLYMAAGMLHWIDPDTGEPAESPLLLIPVDLHRENPREPYELRRADEDVVLNPALEVKLADFGVELPGLPEAGEADLDFDETLRLVRRRVAKQKGWEVHPRLVIGPFSFHKEVMYRDLLKNEDEIAEHAIIQALALGAKESSELDFEPIDEAELDDEAPPETATMILDADATQRQCIAAAEAGSSFVMDGPPGTGKSQTISNMIAELLEKGRTVLFVSEKAAALEVVQKRLIAAGLGDYTLELHSHKATRKEVAQQLGASLELYPQQRSAMSATEVKRLGRRRRELSVRAEAVNRVRQPLGRSLHQAIGRVAQLHDLPHAPPPEVIDAGLGADRMASLLVGAEEIARAWGPVERGDEFLWRALKDPQLDATRQQRTAEQVATARRALEFVRLLAIDAAEELLLSDPNSTEGAEGLVRVASRLSARPSNLPTSWLTAESLEAVENRFEEARKLHDSFRESEKALRGVLGERWRSAAPEAAERVTAATDALAELAFPLDVRAQISVDELQKMHAFIGRAPAMVEVAARGAETIARTFGLSASRVSLTRALELTELGDLAAEEARPESDWVRPGLIDSVEEASDVLRPLVSSFAERRDGLEGVFTDQVLTLELESLCARFKDVHTGVGKLRGAYRADKRTVASATVTGKATKEAISLLPEALEWQNASHQLEEAEKQHASLLGFYYRRTETDFEAIARACKTVRRIIAIAGLEYSPDVARQQLTRGMAPEPEMLAAALRVRESIEQWSLQANQILGDPLAGELLTTSFDSARDWCMAAATQVGVIAEEAARIQQVSGRPLSAEQALGALAERASADALETRMKSSLERDKALLGPDYLGLETGWGGLSAAIRWASDVRPLVGGAVSSTTAGRLQEASPDFSQLESALAGWYRERDDVLDHFDGSHADDMRSDLASVFADVSELLEALEDTVGDIEEWAEHVRAQQALRALGVGGVIEFCIQQRVRADAVPQVIERACLERWIDSVIEQESDQLKHLRAEQLEPIVEEFRTLDAELVKAAAGRVIAACNARRPRTTVGAAGVIKREAAKQRKHMPVRRLLEDAGEVAQALKPCFMMSPLTVSQFLPPSLRFDAVIFDEASQVRPSDAVNCIYRGGQLIVAGDDKQLPPTSFFEAVSIDGEDEWEEDQFDEFESILELARGSGGFRALPLRWHYRSQHEDLITYSNQSFYDGRLVTFPGAVAEGDDLGVTFVHVPDGLYRRGTSRDNPKEAEKVVDRVLHWARWSLATPDRNSTIGVVAFSEAQASCIETELERRRRDLPELDEFFSEDRLDGFFIKNLENVQGDERDIMIFSVGYGRDENTKLTMNFGPLNRPGGRRRLNVAITRARRRVEVVSSIDAGDFTADISEGPRHLQRYLDYANRGPKALALEVGESGLDVESPFEEEVLRVIRSWGYTAQPQVGTAGFRVDIGVRHPARPGQFALGVECDGWMYHSSKVARDRDRLRQEVLERLGWRIHRIWGTAWYRNRPQQEERLQQAIDQAIAGELDRRSIDEPSITSDGGLAAFEPVALDEIPSWTQPYQVAQARGPNRANVEMYDPEAVGDLRRMIREVVSVEGPVHDELVLQRVREAWGKGRAGSRIRDAFESAVRYLNRRSDIVKAEKGFLAESERQLKAVRVPTDAQARRNVDEVPKAELRLAVEHLVRDARRVSADELTREVARLFGWSRRGPDIARALHETVDNLINKGRIERDGDWLRPV